jgi:hypothetical protein
MYSEVDIVYSSFLGCRAGNPRFSWRKENFPVPLDVPEFPDILLLIIPGINFISLRIPVFGVPRFG